ncbi:heavy metal atpase 2 [Euphorbia peplus]|nr:heavy metal atpase 2 [Euphorbia peplus]
MATQNLEKSYFDVLGLCCSSEKALIENIINSLDGVKKVSVIVPTRTVIVVHDTLLTSQLQIVKALNQARLEANVRVKGGSRKGYERKWPSPFALLSGILLLISLFKSLYHPLEWVALAAVAVGILPIIIKAFASIRNFRMDISFLMLIAVGGTIAIHDYVEAAAIVFLFSIGLWLESMATHKASDAMSALMKIAPQKAVIAETGEEIDVDQVKINTILAVKAGETIPIDGVVIDGNCEVDERFFTGESYPVLKQKDSIVWAGTINLNGYISVKTSAVAEDCMVAKMAKLVEEAQSSQSKVQQFIDKIAKYYTPAIVLIAVGLAVIPLALRVHNEKHWVHIALVFLVSGCPCALILSTPVATFCALTKAASNGVLIKGGDHLENLAKIKVMAFDKTGTLTRGEFVVSQFQCLSQHISLQSLLFWVSSIESKSSHPMASALIDHAKRLSIEPNPENVVEFQNFPGEGICGIIDGKHVYIGNTKIGTRAGYSGTLPMLEMDANKGKSVGYVYCGANLVGIFSLSDVCRTGVEEAIADLKSLHIKTAMLTGDTQASAMHIQQQLGNALEHVHSQLLPEDKSSFITTFKKEGITAMVGDGVNDAPALATADIGISMGISGSALATETGHVILMSNDIRKVPETIKLARKAHRKVIENVFLSISTKSIVLALAFSGHPLVWAAVLADVGTCLMVIFNSMLLLHGTAHTHGTKGKCCKKVEKTTDCCSNKKVENSCKSSHCSSTVSSKTCSDSSEAKNCCKSNDLEANNPHTHCNTNHSNHSHDEHKEKKSHCCSNKKVEKSCKSSHGSSTMSSKTCLDSSEAKNCCKSMDLEVNNLHTHCNTRRSNHSHDDHQEKTGHCGLNKKVQKSCKSSLCSSTVSSKTSLSSSEVKSCCKSTDLEANIPHTHCHTNHSNHSHPVHKEKSGHCQSKHDHTDVVDRVQDDLDSVGKIDELGLEHDHQHPVVVKKCCDGNNSNPTCSTVNDIHEDMTSFDDHQTKSGTILENRELESCCKSYLKHCCKHGQFGHGFGGGLHEIITE